nr:hypothetical protein [uncultured Flavobacterium sp.]
MFWNYEEWTNAFLIQFFAIIVAFVVGKKNQVNKPDLILAISLVSPVALFNVSAGVAGAIFLSDLIAIYMFFREHNTIRKTTVVVLAFILYLAWPILSTLFSIIYGPYSSEIIGLDSNILTIQFLRYFLYFILLVKLVSKPFTDPIYILKLFKVQSVMLFFIFTAILLGYFGMIKVDAWNELVEIDFYDSTLGKGGMFLYRGGVGTLGTISIPIIYYCFLSGKGFYKYLMEFLIFIILTAVLFSGSRQGITLSLLSLLLSMFLFKQYKNATQILIVGFVLFFFAMQNDSIRKTSEWVFNRYEILLSDKIDLGEEVKERNFSLDIAKKQKKDSFYEINGFGLGGPISPTESDYYNTYSYFGVIGSIIYYIFIFYCASKIYLNWQSTTDRIMKNIFLISFLIALIMPIYGFQQWYIMTYGSNNSMNVYLILFICALGLVKKKNTTIYDYKK